MEIRFYGHLRRRQASLFHADIRFSAHRNPESHTLSIGSVRLSTIFLSTSSLQHFRRQVYKLSATNRGCLQVEYSSTPAEGNRHGAGSTAWCQHSIVSTMRKGISHEGLLSVYSSIVYGKVGMRIRRLRGCSCAGSQSRSFSTLFTNKNPITPELRYLTAKMAAQLPFGMERWRTFLASSYRCLLVLQPVSFLLN